MIQNSKVVKDLAEKNQEQIQKWIVAINNYKELSNIEHDYASGQFEEGRKICDIFAEMFELCLKHGNFKDEWNYDFISPEIFGVFLIIKSKKLGATFNLGMENGRIKIRSNLYHTQHLKSMNEEFWKKILSIADYEGFEYREWESTRIETRKNYPKLFHSHQGVIFRMFRKYFFDMTIDQNNHNEDPSLGELSVSWGTETDFLAILENLCHVFKNFYQLNYALWKIEDIKQKRKM